MTKKLLLFLIFFFIFPKQVSAEMVINEFSSGTTTDWVEIYNTGTVSAQLSGFRIGDSTSSNKKDLSGELGAREFQVVTFSNWLNNDGDVVKLIRVVGEKEELLEEMPYGSAGGLCTPTGSGSIGRFPDGGSSIVRFLDNTQGVSNNGAQEDLCPTPTPTPTSTPIPSPSPTSKPLTPTSTKTPTPTSTVTPKTTTPTLTLKAVSISATLSGEILGNQSSESGGFYPLETTQSADLEEELEDSSLDFLPKVFLVVGLVLLLVAGFWVWYNLKHYQED